jgi:hypothetical protein
MKPKINSNLLLVLIGLTFTTAVFGQGTTVYVSGVNKPSDSFGNVASDSWLAQRFGTGTYSNGYLVTSVQLQLTNATGNPNGLVVSIYSQNGNLPGFPGSLLAPLTGDSNPLTSGIYSYSAANVVLAPNLLYFLVVTSSQPLSAGSFRWQTIAFGSQFDMDGLVVGLPARSVDGMVWERSSTGIFQFSLTAMTVPEPTGSMLMLAAAILSVRQRRKRGSR